MSRSCGAVAFLLPGFESPPEAASCAGNRKDTIGRVGPSEPKILALYLGEC